ncbi:CvpA family protein [Sphingobium sp. B11D3D]|uniref:CvpA family protein n=1 Tax=Sphingobium sp. B11D3D TaxID=2940576 RepID=UPI00222527A4|nr:CvpA family protein [Sphingobium sp. B11D3D]MCW2369420.1 membrane protein required for colicin V production [Sphingobium sp. B11D3D]
MTVLDFAVLLLIGGLAVRGFLRGFVTESLSLAALIGAIVAVRLFHAPFTALLDTIVGAEYVAALLAFVAVFGVVFMLGTLLARWIGDKTKTSLLGLFDRTLGLGFGAIKGLLVATIAFVLFTIGYDAIYGVQTNRPDWMRLSRSYPLLSASGSAMSGWMAENSRRGGLLGILEDDGAESSNASGEDSNAAQ